MKTLQDLNNELWDDIHDGWIPEPGFPTEDLCRFDFENASDCELGWNDPLTGFGFYFCYGIKRDQKDARERAFDLMERTLRNFLIAQQEKDIRFPYKLEFERTIEILEMDNTSYITLSTQLKSHTYKS